jgi:hypothetical protein
LSVLDGGVADEVGAVDQNYKSQYPSNQCHQ